MGFDLTCDPIGSVWYGVPELRGLGLLACVRGPECALERYYKQELLNISIEKLMI